VSLRIDSIRRKIAGTIIRRRGQSDSQRRKRTGVIIRREGLIEARISANATTPEINRTRRGGNYGRKINTVTAEH
jgi:hypothetical protein